MHERLSVHNVTFYGASIPEIGSHISELGLTRLSLLDTHLHENGLADLVRGRSVDTVYHLFSTPEALSEVIQAAAAVGTRAVYMLTGGRDGRSWEQAAQRFCAEVAPCVQEAAEVGVTLAIENASGLYADIHIAHTLHDTVTLAEMAGIGVCIDVFHCWTEAGIGELVGRAAHRIVQVQLSDYVLGDRALPARAVPGDGAIPLEWFVEHVLAEGYPHGFDLELIGPRIEQEGRFEATRRACETVAALLNRVGA